ncbi:hypothetical protein OG739_01730 [Streptomyces longwoodensis]|uniref:hypothetical protein n=1 Tax=Streptomyces longwoodensis TaxID=68231 RepID=UPI00324D7BB1
MRSRVARATAGLLERLVAEAGFPVGAYVNVYQAGHLVCPQHSGEAGVGVLAHAGES